MTMTRLKVPLLDLQAQYAPLRDEIRTALDGVFDKLAFIGVAGGLVFAVVWLLTTALTLGDASVVIPLANMGFIAAFVFSVILKLERIDARKLAAVALAAVAVALLTQAT